jgi:hypothetical protein
LLYCLNRLPCLIPLLQVVSTRNIQVGQWLRVFVTAPNNRNRRRSLLASEDAGASQQLKGSRRGLRQAEADAADAPPLVDALFEDSELAAALNASFVAENQKAAALAANPDKVPAQWFEPNATNPLGMDPWLLEVGRFAASALLADSDKEAAAEDDGGEKAPGLALDGTLDAYLYGENIADSGRNGGEQGRLLVGAAGAASSCKCLLLTVLLLYPVRLWHADVYPRDDHIRFLSR